MTRVEQDSQDFCVQPWITDKTEKLRLCICTRRSICGSDLPPSTIDKKDFQWRFILYAHHDLQITNVFTTI